MTYKISLNTEYIIPYMYVTLKEYMLNEWASVPAGASISPSDPSMSNNYWTSYKKNYINNLTTLQNLVMTRNNNGKKKVDPMHDPKEVTIIKMVRNGGTVDINMSFRYDDDEMWCVIKSYGAAQERFSCPDMRDRDDIDIIKRKLKSYVSDWVRSPNGSYKQLKQDVVWYDNTGALLRTKEGSDINILRATDTYIIAEDKAKNRLRMTTPDNYFFNYWFEKRQ